MDAQLTEGRSMVSSKRRRTKGKKTTKKATTTLAFPRVYVDDVVDGVDACGDPWLDSSRVVVVGIVTDLLDMAWWLMAACSGGDVDGGRP